MFLYSKLENGKSCLWIDDDDDMKFQTFKGDLDSDCLLIDMNGDKENMVENLNGLKYRLYWLNKRPKCRYQMIVDNGKKRFSW